MSELGKLDPGDPRSELAARIAADARLFELPSLVRLLHDRFPRHSLRYRSRSSLACAPSLVDKVEFGASRIVIQLNLGLLSSTSPLASYFLKLRHDTRAGPALEQLLCLCDDALLRARADANQAPRAEHSSSSSGSLRQTFWQLNRPRSLASLHWLFKRLFPELEVAVERSRRKCTTPSAVARNGWATLGGTALGAETSITVPGFEVTLAADESESLSGEAWQRELKQRLSQLSFEWPSRAANLRITLVDRQGRQCLSLHGPELGFSSLTESCPPNVCHI
jgi:hypothetical protein